jgi:hypothetical protein
MTYLISDVSSGNDRMKKNNLSANIYNNKRIGGLAAIPCADE